MGENRSAKLLAAIIKRKNVFFVQFLFQNVFSLLVVSIYVRRNRLDSIQRQNLRRGLSQGLRKALNDTTAQAQVMCGKMCTLSHMYEFA